MKVGEKFVITASISLYTLGFLSNKAILRCVSPFLKTVLDDICPCSSVSIILPDVSTDRLSSFTDWLLAGCNGEFSSGRKSWSDLNNYSEALFLRVERDPRLAGCQDQPGPGAVTWNRSRRVAAQKVQTSGPRRISQEQQRHRHVPHR